MKFILTRQSDVFSDERQTIEVNTVEELKDLARKGTIESIQQHFGYFHRWSDEDVANTDIEEEGYRVMIDFGDKLFDTPIITIVDDYTD